MSSEFEIYVTYCTNVSAAGNKLSGFYFCTPSYLMHLSQKMVNPSLPSQKKTSLCSEHICPIRRCLCSTPMEFALFTAKGMCIIRFFHCTIAKCTVICNIVVTDPQLVLEPLHSWLAWQQHKRESVTDISATESLFAMQVKKKVTITKASKSAVLVRHLWN